MGAAARIAARMCVYVHVICGAAAHKEGVLLETHREGVLLETATRVTCSVRCRASKARALGTHDASSWATAHASPASAAALPAL